MLALDNHFSSYFVI